MVVYLITDDNYFFIGLQAVLNKEFCTLKLISHKDASSIDSKIKHEASAFVFHTSQYDYLPYSLFSFMNHRGGVVIISPKHLIKFYSSFNFGHVINEKSEIEDISQAISSVLLGKKTYPYNNIKLTNSEKNILLHIMNGHSTAFISDFLDISIKTVYTHKRNALHKLGARKITDIIRTRKPINNPSFIEDMSMFLTVQSRLRL